MDCNVANEFMMKYMDMNISSEEFLELKKHLSTCKECMESFAIYTEVVDDFSFNMENELIEVPNDFEQYVIKTIEGIKPSYIKEKVKKNYFIYGILSIWVIITSIGIILNNYDKNILAEMPTFYKYILFISNIDLKYIIVAILENVKFFFVYLQFSAIVMFLGIVFAISKIKIRKFGI